MTGGGDWARRTQFPTHYVFENENPHANTTSKNHPSKALHNTVLKYVSILQCNIGGNPKARLAKGSVLRKLIFTNHPTFILLTETKRKRAQIPILPNYSLLSLDPLKGCSGGIAFYFEKNLCFHISVAFTSVNNSILWVHLQHHISRSKDLYICGVYAPNASCIDSRKTSFYEELNSTTFQFQKRPGHCILAGEFNARIGDISGDHATNSNMNPFLLSPIIRRLSI